MDTSDDPVTLGLVVGGGIMGGMFLGKKLGGEEPDMPVVHAEQAKATAGPVTTLSESEKRSKRLKAGALVQNWGEPNIGSEGLLGL